MLPVGRMYDVGCRVVLHLAVGRCTISSVVLCLAVLGLVGIYLKWTKRLPEAPPRAAAARHRVETPLCPQVGMQSRRP